MTQKRSWFAISRRMAAARAARETPS